jgi:hypothetical protein
MKKYIQRCGLVALGIVVISLSGCATCGTSYRKELTQNHKLAEANESYRKAIVWLDKAECASTPSDTSRCYITAESYLSDAIFKLKKLGHDNAIDVSEDVYYCEKIKTETDVNIGKAGKAATP